MLRTRLVNGLQGSVLAVEPFGITVRLEDGRSANIWRTTRPYVSARGHRFFRAALELELGYCMTVHQAEGHTLPELCIIFESFSPPGWGYTALTRAVDRHSLRVVGHITPEHFQPRRPRL